MIHGKLRNKILVMMALVSVIPLIVLGIIAVYSLNVSHAVDVQSIEDNLVNQKREEIESFVENIRGTFQLRVSFDQIGDIALTHQKFLLTQLLEEITALEEVSFINLEGKETARFNYAVLEGVPEDELQNQKHIEKFKIARTGKDYISPIYFTRRGPMVTIASPVLNRNNLTISVLAGEVNLSELKDIIEKSALGKQGYMYLVNRDGFLIAHSKRDYAPTLASMRLMPFVNSLFVETSKETNENNRYRNFWGTPVVASGGKLEKFEWGIVAEWPIVEADTIVKALRNEVLITTLLVMMITVIISMFLANRIVGPIKKLQMGTERVAKGFFDEKVTIKTRDEIEELGQAFNTMMAGLKQLEELKKEFVFIAAHELRTPVTAIKGYLSMVLDGTAGPVTENVKTFIVKVITANERLVQLVNDLLQIARAEAGKLTVNVAPIDIIPHIKEVLSELQPLAHEKEITCVYEPSPLPKVLADAARLKEVVVNLVGNAIKYTIGSGTVTITHEIQEGKVITHVQDTGLGISKEAQKKLFEKFYRVQTDQTKDITGTGLGLFIVKEIIEKMNGTIWVESPAFVETSAGKEEGKGSVFSFMLPLVNKGNEMST